MGRTACTKPQCLYKGDLYLYLTLTVCLVLAVDEYTAVTSSVYLFL